MRAGNSFQHAEDRVHMERIRKNLQVLREQPEIYNRCLNLLEQGDNAVFCAINSSDPNEKKAGIYLIVCLVELNSAEENNQMTRFARKLLKNLTCSDESATRLASRAIVYLIQVSKTYAALMEQALNQCCEQLEETQRNEDRLLAAVILARDLAFFTSSQFFQRAPQFFNNIYKIIRDVKLNLRLAAVQALQVALAIASQRETKGKNDCYKRCFDEACTRSGREESVHASLLIFNELLRIANAPAEKMRLKALDISANSCNVIGPNPVEWLMTPAHFPAVESRTARAFVTEHYFTDIVNRCMALTNARSANCQLVLLEIFPRLCHFSETYDNVPFNDMLNHSINLTSKYPQALLTIGLLAVVRPEEIRPKVPNIMKIVVQIIQQCVTRKKPVDIYVFKCLTLLVSSQRDSLSHKIHEIFPLLFATGLSKGLTEVLKEIVDSIPELKVDVLDGLLEQHYQLLMNCPRPNKLAAPTSPPVPTEPIQPTNVKLTKLALKTLGKFEFQRHALQMFMRYIAQGYLTCDSVEIRLASVYCCSEIVKPFVKIHETTENEQKLEVHSLIKNVLECLARTAVVDPEVEVRLRVLKCFCAMERDFLYHLAQDHMLENLFKTLYDEDYRMQEEAVSLLGQIYELNPAMVLPKLRKKVLESISQMMNSYVPKIEEHSAKIIAKLAVQAPKFMSPYMNPLLLALLPHLQLERRSKVEVTISVMNALSELSLIGGLELVRSVDKVFPSLIAFLHDSTSLNRREAALRAIGAICQSTGYVVDPYKDYLELLDILLKLLKTELSASMRHLTMKVLGIIGALDPYTHKVYLGKIHSHKSNTLALSLPNVREIDDNKSDVSDVQQWINYERCTLLEYYPALTIANLVEILEDEALTSYHQEVVNALFQIFKNLGSKSSQFVKQVVPRLIKITEESKPELRKFFLGQFSKFAAIVGICLKPHMKEILAMTAKAWNWRDNDEFRCIVIGVLEEIGKTFGQEFAPYVTDLCPYLLDIIENDRSERKKLVLQALSCVCSVVSCVSAHIHLILPPILSVLDDRTAMQEVRESALDTLILLAKTQCIGERAPTIMQTWLRCIAVKLLQPKLMELLQLVMRQMWDQFLVYKDAVNSALLRHKTDQKLIQEFLEQVAQIESTAGGSSASGALLPRIHDRRDFQNLHDAENKTLSQRQISLNAGGRESHHLINMEQLQRFWTANSLNSRNDWLQWLAALRTAFIRQSPSAFIRACANLADSHEHLAKSLFNAAFMSVWTEINEIDQTTLSNRLVDVLTLCPHAEPVQAILNLAEFMDHSEKGPLPVNYNTLSKCAEQTRAYAKALRYKELEVITAQNEELNADDCQALIIYANKLNLEEYSAGLVKYAEKMGMEISGRWYEKLGEWEKALDMYETEISDRPRNQSHRQTFDASPQSQHSPNFSQNIFEQQNEESKIRKDDLVIYQMRCLEALGKWTELQTISQNALADSEEQMLNCGGTSNVRSHHSSGNVGMRSTRSDTISGTGYLNMTLNEADKRQKIAQMAARASWASGDFTSMHRYVQKVNQNTQDGAFLRAVLAIKNDECKDAINYISKVRDMFDSDLTAMAAESYERAYGATVLLQQLTELEEAIEYKTIPERRPRIALLWSRRLQGCRRNIGYWQKLLQVRSVVMSQAVLRPTWIKFAAMCRRQGKLSMSKSVLVSLLDMPPDTQLFPLSTLNLDEHSPQLSFAICKQLWIEGQRREAFASLDSMTSNMHRLIDRKRRDRSWTRDKLEVHARITAKCYLKLGEWHLQLQSIVAPPAFASLGGIGMRRGSVTVPPGASNFSVLSGNNTSARSTIQQQYLRHYQQEQQFQPQGVYAQNSPTSEQNTALVLKYYINATNFNPSWYKAWHRLATTYYNLVMSDRQSKSADNLQRISPNVSASPQSQSQQVPVVNSAALGVNNVILANSDAAFMTQYQQQQAVLLQGHAGMVAQAPIGYVAPVSAFLPPAMIQNQTIINNYGGRYLPQNGATQGILGVAPNAVAMAGNFGYAPMIAAQPHPAPPGFFYASNATTGGGVLPSNLAMYENTASANLCGGAVAAQALNPPAASQNQFVQHSRQTYAPTTFAAEANIAAIIENPVENDNILDGLRQRQQHVRFDVDGGVGQNPAVISSASASNISPQSSIGARIQQQNQLISFYAAHAVRCFFKTLQLAEGSRLDDTLRLLMLWFEHGDRPEVFEVLRDSLKLVPLEVWLEVMPQLIARLDSQQNTGLLVKQLVIDISKVHPQALLYALTAAAKSRNSHRSRVAKEILQIMSDARPTLIEQAQLLNDELIRCAILWHELWHEALEDASRFYFQEKNTDEMMNVLRPLHAKIMRGHETLKEQSFIHTYYQQLKEAYDHCETFHRSKDFREMQSAWELYFMVFKQISSQLRVITFLDLNYISPRLAAAKNLEITVPGTYDPQSPPITITSVHHHLQVIASKQRPRKIYMKGSDGKEYAFLLKGHEDPRQDERVMQLFGLINSLILREADTCRRNISIQRYSIITLSQTSGLIGWLPSCDTLHALIKDYREKKGISLSEEHNKMLRMVVDIEKVMLMQKVEIFEETLRSTSGDDLRQALWMKSPNSEIWFEHRTNYTRSMACMSMIGYILGLGDRHPSNLMLDRLNGKIVHIDFGDCFEVAMIREKYPEKIPFRLTRMLVKTMEITGIEGNYRLTCERVLRLLRNSNDSILAVLEAFVYDPVVNWRLTEGLNKRRTDEHGGDTVMNRSETSRRGDSEAINRVKAKLCGTDFNQYTEITVSEQVNRLIEQATLNDNLCQCYIGWCPFW